MVLAGSLVRLNVRMEGIDSLEDVPSGDLARDITTVGKRVSTALVLGDLAFLMVTLGNGTIADKMIFGAAEQTLLLARVGTRLGGRLGESPNCYSWSRRQTKGRMLPKVRYVAGQRRRRGEAIDRIILIATLRRAIDGRHGD